MQRVVAFSHQTWVQMETATQSFVFLKLLLICINGGEYLFREIIVRISWHSFEEMTTLGRRAAFFVSRSSRHQEVGFSWVMGEMDGSYLEHPVTGGAQWFGFLPGEAVESHAGMQRLR